MTEWTTLSVKEQTRDRFNQMKAEINDGHIPEQSADTFLQSLMDTWEAADDGYYNETEEIEVDLSEVLGRIDDLETSLPKKVAEEVRHG